MSLNPYQPPSEIQHADDWLDGELIEGGDSIRFAGAPDVRDLNGVLANFDAVDVYTSFAALLLCTLVLIWTSLVASVAAIMVAAGLCGIVAVACVVSTKAYRRAMFGFANRYWNDPAKGEVTSQGVLIEREHGSLFLHWNCLEAVVVGPEVVGLLTPAMIGESMIVNPSMTQSESDFAKLLRACELVSRKVVTAGTIDQRQQTIAALMSEPSRQRSVDLPVGAIGFAGPVTMQDFERIDRQLPAKMMRRKRSTHGMITVALLLLCAMLIVTGLASAFAADIGPVGVLVFFLIPPLGYMWLQTRNRPVRQANDLLQYLHGFADDEGITSDAHAVVTKLPWSHIKCIAKEADRLIFRHTHSRRIVTTRRDMFASEHDWQAMIDLASTKSKRASAT